MDTTLYFRIPCMFRDLDMFFGWEIRSCHVLMPSSDLIKSTWQNSAGTPEWMDAGKRCGSVAPQRQRQRQLPAQSVPRIYEPDATEDQTVLIMEGEHENRGQDHAGSYHDRRCRPHPDRDQLRTLEQFSNSGFYF